MRGSAAFRTSVTPGGALAGPWVRNPLWNAARSVPSLDLRFADNKSLVDATTGQNLVTFTRASSGTYVGSDRLIKTATTNEARFDHSPTTGESLGLLVEESRTNLCLQSEAWDTSPWTSTAPYSVTANAIAAPDGTQTADALIVASGSSSFTTNVTRQIITKAASALQYTRSAYFKALGSTTSVRVSDFGSSAANGASAVVSLVDGSIVTAPSVAGSFSGASVAVSNAGNGWWRVAFTYTTDTATSLTIRSFPYVGAGVLTGDGSSGLYVWGVQLEAGAFPTSYIPTTTATVTRSADVASIEGTVFGDFTRTASTNTQQGRVFSFSDGTNTNLLEIYQTGGSNPAAQIIATTSQAGWIASNFTVGTSTREVLGYQLNNTNASFNGSSETADTVCTMPNALTQARIGDRQDGVRTLNGTIRRLTYFPTRLPNETLQGITQ